MLVPVKFDGLRYHESDVAQAITTASGSGNSQDQFVTGEPRIIELGNYKPGGHACGKVVSAEGISPTVMENHGSVVTIAEPEIMQIGSYSPSSACNAKVLDPAGLCPTLLDHKGMEPAIVIGSMQANAMRGSIDGVSPCLTEAMGMGGGQIPMVTVARQDNIAYKRMPNGNIRAFDASTPDKRGISELQIVNPDNECPTITTAHEPKVLLRYRIRKLTERECFRLMDVSDSDIDKIEAHRIKVTLKNGTVKEKPIPKSAKYKLAGNSIVVSCLYHIFHQMFIAEPPEPKPIQKSLFDL